MQKHHYVGYGGLVGVIGGLGTALYAVNASIIQLTTACSQGTSLIPTP